MNKSEVKEVLAWRGGLLTPKRTLNFFSSGIMRLYFGTLHKRGVGSLSLSKGDLQNNVT